MKITIIPSEQKVYQDTVSYEGLNLVGIPSNVHALQWQDTQGHLEFTDGTPNEEIAVLPQWANDALVVWSVEQAKQPVPTPATPPILTDAQKLSLIRIDRNNRISASDWTQLADIPSNVDKAAWVIYRQALREFPNNPTLNIDSPIWPLPPTLS